LHRKRHLGTAALAAVLLGAPMWAHAASATIAFGSLADLMPSVSDPVAVQGSHHVDNATATVDFLGSASLIDGTMRAKVRATPHSVFLSSPVASTSALLNDHLKVIGPGTGLVPLQLRMDVDALMTIDPGMGPNDMDTLTLSTYMSIDNALSSSLEVMRRKSIDDQGVVTEDSIECIGAPCNLNQPLTLAGVIDGQVILNLQVTPGVNIPFSAYLVVFTYSSLDVFGEVDASQTARISYVLPDGYTLSSQSGVFLTAVPEPSAVVLASMGLALLAWRGRRRA
jgi:hypothetical protein